jgi:hypothetical protein
MVNGTHLDGKCVFGICMEYCQFETLRYLVFGNNGHGAIKMSGRMLR